MSAGKGGSRLLVYVLAAAVVVLAVALAALYLRPPSGPQQTTAKQEAKLLEIYHWWTSGGEAAAINALVKAFENRTGVLVVQSPVAGGAGYVMKALMKTMVAAGEAPDSFQMHLGYEMLPYVQAGYFVPIDDIWQQSGLANAVPPVIQDMARWGGHYWAVPLGVHRANVLWYNKRLLDAHGIDPATLTTWDALFAACERLRREGVQYPIAMGGIGKWEIAHALEQIIASVDLRLYQDIINGNLTNPSDPRLLRALEIFRRYLDYVNPDYASLTWDQAVARVIRGEAAFTVMGDWANGEFYVAGKAFGVDYGAIPVPGTQGVYGLVIDSFQLPMGAKHPGNARQWLLFIASREAQDVFNPIKGSIPPRTDADPSRYGPYQRQAMADFRNARYMYPSIVHGSGAPERFAGAFNDIASAFAADRDVAKAARALVDAVASAKQDFVKAWRIVS